MSFGGREMIAVLLFAVVGAATARGDDARARCAWRTGEKLGFGFAEICTPSSAPKGLLEESPGDVAPFWISAAPLPCSQGSHDANSCAVATSLLTARSRAKDVLEPRKVAVLDGETAYGVCGMRFGGRLPTRAERELARYSASVATLVSMRDPGEAHPWVGELPEWTQVGDCTNPSQPNEDCKLAIFPPVVTRQRSSKTVLQSCRAAFAPASIESAIQPGSACAGGTCMFRLSPTLWPEAFQLTCAPVASDSTPAAGKAKLRRAAVRCVVPESGLGVVGRGTSR